MSAIPTSILTARDILSRRGYKTAISQGCLLVDVDRTSARQAGSVCIGHGLEYQGLETVAGQSVARFS